MNNLSALINRRRLVVLGAALISVLLLLTLYSTDYTPEFVQHGVENLQNHLGTGGPSRNETKPAPTHIIDHDPDVYSEPDKAEPEEESEPKGERLAFATWLSGTLVKPEDDDMDNDKYFIATRILLWQLLHVPETRAKGIDVVVMVTPSVSEKRRERLRRDGAIIHPVEFLHSATHWEKGEHDRWNDIMSKLRVFEMTQYSRIVLLDGDTMLLHRLDGVFNDPAAQLRNTTIPDDYKPLEGAPPLPSKYLLSSCSEVATSDHDFPPTKTTGIKTPGYFNAGFFMLAPSREAFEYYRYMLNTPGSFDSQYMEQNLLNTAHKWEGPMPWQELSYTWNLREPNENDFEKGVVSVHEKWWEQAWIFGNEKVKDWLRTRRFEMKGWYDAYDSLTQHGR